MIIYVDLQWQMQLTADKREGLIPFWVQVPMHDSGTVLELSTLELHIGITSACTELQELL